MTLTAAATAPSHEDMPRSGPATLAGALRLVLGMNMAAFRTLALLLAVVFLTAAPVAQAQPISKEYQVKAAFLYNFTKFVEWPPQDFASATSPIVIAVFGKNPFDQELAALVKDRSVNGRPIQVRAIQAEAELATAHIVFVGAGEESRLPSSIYGEHGVLTVGESSEFSRRGGIITFTLVEGKVRFEINQGSGEKAGLKLSGQLLKLAVALRKAP